MERKENRYIRFDWAMKRLLRNKANFDVLEEASAEGRAEGRAEGERNKTLELARKFKQAGVDVNLIASSTGLSVEEIASL